MYKPVLSLCIHLLSSQTTVVTGGTWLHTVYCVLVSDLQCGDALLLLLFLQFDIVTLSPETSHACVVMNDHYFSSCQPLHLKAVLHCRNSGRSLGGVNVAPNFPLLPFPLWSTNCNDVKHACADSLVDLVISATVSTPMWMRDFKRNLQPLAQQLSVVSHCW